MAKAITAVQVISAIFLIISVLFQQRGTGLGGVFGGSGASFRTKRGAERFLFTFTIVMALAFFSMTVLSLVLFA
ncbi:preprotein translocase subunit SecG [bacterium (Candidatus Howlettbacteria) CG_4_10_14_0_8_um_filter_40_9]|nr:MAG: preprotein translocase subunit SecG [bacterium (Candidatus Howlettbacteria) CG_4_10_14_0_8_um_filter_40_9]